MTRRDAYSQSCLLLVVEWYEVRYALKARERDAES